MAVKVGQTMREIEPMRNAPHDSRVFLFLQGPHGPFFARLAGLLRQSGAACWRVGFNAGDRLFWPDRSSYLPYRGGLEDWPDVLARIVAERIRLEIATHPFIVKDGAAQLPVTVSLGVSTLESANDTPEKMMKRADVALYNAKRAGRNQVMTEAA